MNWINIREYADRPIELPITGTIELDVSEDALQTVAGRSIVLQAIESEVAQLSLGIAQGFATARDAFAHLSDVSRPRELILPWLPTGRGDDQPVAHYVPLQQIARCFDVQKPLVGQRCDRAAYVARFHTTTSRDFVSRPIEITIESIVLDEGSIKARIKTILQITGATLTLAFAAFATPPGQEKYDDWRFTQRVERVIEGQRCTTVSDFRADLSSLRALALEDLNYDAPNLRPEERVLRACNVQLALAVAQGTPALIDGQFGPRTRDALVYYAKQKGLAADIRDDRLRALLLEELQRLRTSR